MASASALGQKVRYWLAEHPSIVGFRWSPAQSWGSTWPFLITSVALYILSTVALHVLLLGCLPKRLRRRPIPLGPLPALHSLTMAILSAAIFAGILASAAAEIRDTRWLWRRSKTTPLQWLVCFPLGTRPSGRVFFWSYAFYLSRFLRLPATLFAVLRRRRLPWAHLLRQSALIVTAFLWLEFSQSNQVLAIVCTTLVSSLVYGYRFWTALGLPAACFPFVLVCHVALVACNVASHLAVLVLHFSHGGGCNGFAAWRLNSFLNAALLLFFFFSNFYVKPRRHEEAHHDQDVDVFRPNNHHPSHKHL